MQLIEFALDHGARLDSVDNDGRAAFPMRARMHWYVLPSCKHGPTHHHSLAGCRYGKVHGKLINIMAKRQSDAFKAAVFADPRTQMSIDTIFRVRLRCKKLAMLVLWALLLGAMMYVAVDETGRDAVYTHAFYRNVEYAFVTEGWGTEWDEVRRAGVRCLRLCVVT